MCEGCCQAQQENKDVDDDRSLLSRISGDEDDLYLSEEVVEKLQHEWVEERLDERSSKMTIKKKKKMVLEDLLKSSQLEKVEVLLAWDDVTKTNMVEADKRSATMETERLREMDVVCKTQQP